MSPQYTKPNQPKVLIFNRAISIFLCQVPQHVIPFNCTKMAKLFDFGPTVQRKVRRGIRSIFQKTLTCTDIINDCFLTGNQRIH